MLGARGTRTGLLRTHLRPVYVRCTLTSLVRYRLPSHHRWRHEDGTPNIDELMHGALRAVTVPVDVDIEIDGVSSGARQTVQMTLEEYAAWWTRQVCVVMRVHCRPPVA